MPFRLTAFGLSDRGRVRSKNEDAMAVEPSRAIVMVADGMGGAPAGEVASSLAVQEVCRALHAGRGLRDAVLHANDRILAMAGEQVAFAGMGTTLTALRVDCASGGFEVAHVGDSRAYRLNGSNLWQLTRDHTVVAGMVEAGTLSPARARDHHLGHLLTRALGTTEDLEVEVVLGIAEAGDRFLVCSDGLMRVMDDDDVRAWLLESRARKLDDLVKDWVVEANRRGAPDNVTVAILALEPQA